MAQAAPWVYTAAHARKRGDPTRLDAMVVHALTEANYVLGRGTFFVP